MHKFYEPLLKWEFALICLTTVCANKKGHMMIFLHVANDTAMICIFPLFR